MNYFLAVYLVLFIVQPSFQLTDYDTSTLKLSHVIFRHGARNPDSYCSIFNVDNNTYFPEGPGALTMYGKQLAYNLGVSLRQRYNNWLGDVYTPDILQGRSTNTDRTKMSLLLVLAGLFPPADNQTWNWEVDWQPIPITFEPQATDTLMGYVRSICPNFGKEIDRVYNTTEVQNMFTALQTTFNTISRYTKPFVPSPYDNMLMMYGCMSYWKELNKTLPAWVTLLYPSLKTPTLKMYEIFTSTPLLQKLGGGQLMKKILTDSEAKLNGTIPTKLFLYSGHEYNVAYVLRVLKSFVPHIPPYAAHLIIELHTINGIDGFKIFYQKYDGPDPVPVIVPGCQEFCPLTQLKTLIAENLPDESTNCYN